jgi:hypothetical protein
LGGGDGLDVASGKSPSQSYTGVDVGFQIPAARLSGSLPVPLVMRSAASDGRQLPIQPGADRRY